MMISITRTSRLAKAHLRTSIHASASASSRNARLSPFSTTSAQLAYKDDQDRESLKPRSKEYTRSGNDGDIASEHGDAAFNPDKTSPETEKDTAGADLEVSPANHDISKPQGDNAEGESRGGEGAGKEKASKGVTPKKAGKAT
jgi:hypothetical protein